MNAVDLITARSQLATGGVAPRSGDTVAAAAGLERMRRLMDALGNPQRAYETIHVAGSKGKGSTVAYAAAILTATGRRTGRYTSPHLMDWRERIAADGIDIPMADFDHVMSYVDSTMSRLEAERSGGTPHNAFELLTAAAFVHFAEVGCQTAVIEVGIGGRFDSTNVIDSDVAVITSIEAEHLDMLGPTIADVAWNKAGIMRADRPCVTVAQKPAVIDRLRAEATVLATGLLEQDRDWSISLNVTPFTVTTPCATYRDLAVAPHPIAPRVQNAAAAVVAVVVSDPSAAPTRGQIQAGLTTGALPGRFEVVEGASTVVLDVAHTAASLDILGRAVTATFPGRRVIVVLGILADKALLPIAAAVATWADSLIAVTAPSPRAHPAADIAGTLAAHGADVTTVPSPDDAWRVVLDRAADDAVLVVTGSFALVAHIRRILIAAE